LSKAQNYKNIPLKVPKNKQKVPKTRKNLSKTTKKQKSFPADFQASDFQKNFQKITPN